MTAAATAQFRSRGGDTSTGRSSGSHGTTGDDHPVITSIDSMSMSTRIVTPTRSTTSSSPAKSTGSEAVIVDGEEPTSSPNLKEVPHHIQMEDNDNDIDNDIDIDKASIAPLMSVGSDDLSSGGGSNSNSISNQMKKMVQTNYAQPPKSPEQMIHKATANGAGDVNSSPLRTTDEPLRYSLGSGSGSGSPTKKHHHHRHSEEGHRRASDGTSKTKLQAAHNLALKSTSTGEQKRVSDTQLLNSRSSSSRRQDPNAYKIFLLLLQPKSKIFELIQLIYSPNDTTLGDILKMIPANATEQTLGTQEYLGLCRPKGEEELLDKHLLASQPTLAGASGDTNSANITLGEILVAIPQGYTGPDVAALSKQILDNPKIVKLLKRSDPLAPKKRRSSRSHRHSSGTSSSRRGSARRQVEILNKLDEEEETNQEQKMKQAMEHATAEAAAANAAIRGGSSMVKITRSDSMRSVSEKSIGNLSMQESLDESYSSWSKSFENSFSTQASIMGGVSRRAMRRKERQVRRMIVLKRTGAAAFFLMIGVYFIDPRGYAEQIDDVTDSPMGLAGIFQTFFLLLTLYKMERFFRIDDGEEQIRRCPFLKASANAMDQLKTRYSNKLKQNPSEKHRRNSAGEESAPSSPHRLRNFSLKADRNSEDDQDTTGSL